MRPLEVKGEGERELHSWKLHSGGNTLTNWGKKKHTFVKTSSRQWTHTTHLCIKIYFLLKISVSDIEPLTYLMWLKINELYTDTDVHFIQCNKAFVSSVRCKDKCPYVWMTDWLIDWLTEWLISGLIGIVSLGEFDCTRCQCDSTTSCTRHPQYVNIWDLLNEFPQRCVFLFVCFFLFKHSFSYLFIHS